MIEENESAEVVETVAVSIADVLGGLASEVVVFNHKEEILFGIRPIPIDPEVVN